ncbi:hypothetical protein FIV42_07420 [Persicimonas caeni]|uniref:Uncharacterized protein n=1 Tax=Persicimonas caeni TaxID=2292766 RepID=A0A4Y6PQH5_PERCE|nr:hypothetical protein [Persicimonas caeni]QDG50568.1 hypothetical protein FIV42_07420 [Persicimonas caeni]QED31789.1 hypothetical protein FRD00_07415 [Persicimonas caeni]
MRQVPQNEFFSSYKLPPSRFGWAARRAKTAAQEQGEPASIVGCADEIVQMCKRHTDMRRQRMLAKRTKVDPAVAASDNDLDRCFSNFVERIEMELDDWGPDSPRGQAAGRMLDGPLHMEVFSVTNATREEQEAITRVILNDLAAHHTADIQTCGLEALFELLEEKFATFCEQMSVQAERAAVPTYAQLQELEAEIQAKVVELVNRVNGRYPTASRADLVGRSAVLGPFAIQNDRAAAFYKQNRNAGVLPDIDPDTGENVTDPVPTDDDHEPEPA